MQPKTGIHKRGPETVPHHGRPSTGRRKEAAQQSPHEESVLMCSDGTVCSDKSLYKQPGRKHQLNQVSSKRTCSIYLKWNLSFFLRPFLHAAVLRLISSPRLPAFQPASPSMGSQRGRSRDSSAWVREGIHWNAVRPIALLKSIMAKQSLMEIPSLTRAPEKVGQSLAPLRLVAPSYL